MPRFRHVPVEVEAVQWTGSNWDEIAAAFSAYRGKVVHDTSSHCLLVDTEEGRMRCMAGSWVVREASGDFNLFWDEAFQGNYQPVVQPDPVLAYHED